MIKTLKQQKQAWKSFITNSLKRPKLGQWSDMSLAPVNTYLLLWSDAKVPYSYYEGMCIGIYVKHDDEQGNWFMIGKTDKDGIFGAKRCNPHWWQPLPLTPPPRKE